MKTLREGAMHGGLARLVLAAGRHVALLVRAGAVVASVEDADADRAWARLLAGEGQKAAAPAVRREIIPSAREGPYAPVVDLLEATDGAVFLTGRAGTGKTTFLRSFLDGTDLKSAIVAPSGIAALNAGGQTAHSLFKLPPALVQPQDVRRVREGRLLKALDLLVIDEVSMVRSDLMDAIDRSMRLHRGDARPFGGVRLLVVGDSAQLPPVVTGEDGAILERWFGGPYFFDAPGVKALNWTAVELTTAFRQSDERFLALLDRLRRGRPTRDDAELLDARVVEGVPDDGGDFIVLTTTNDAAMARIPGPSGTYAGQVDGQFDDRLFPTDADLALKPGARVMLLRNDPDRRWVNGTIGTVESLGETSVQVRIGRRVHEVEPVSWERYAFDLGAGGEPERKTVGSFKQIPLRPAWALTIHKAQGLTFDRVHVDFGRGAFAHGQTYVALSRCRSLEGLTLSRHLRRTDVRVDDAAFAFLDRARFTDHAAYRSGPIRVV